MSTLTAAGIPLEAWNVLCAREFAGMTQPQLADALSKATGQHWTGAMVRHMEKGKKSVSVPTAKAVCQVTGYPWAWFTSDPSVETQRERTWDLDEAIAVDLTSTNGDRELVAA